MIVKDCQSEACVQNGHGWEGWHAECDGRRTMRLQTLPSAARRHSLNTLVARRLHGRGVSLLTRSGEDTDRFDARIETALMALFRDEGDDGAFQALYDHARGRLLVWIAGLLGTRRSDTDPAEVLQDTFVNIYRYAGSFRDEDAKSFRVWSRTIAGNLVRRARHRQRVRPLADLPEGTAEPIDRRDSPADAMVHDEDARTTGRAWMIVLLQYAAAYERLSQRDRVALDLVEVQGLSYAEAGARLKVGLSNMKMIMFRSRRRIRSQIAARFEASVAERVSA
ncbi:MAG: RNA polymerase sigma factor [Planctomycetes bacterium]|nr:RNA polymerase sigma factor [Planctomycetota bacterium]